MKIIIQIKRGDLFITYIERGKNFDKSDIRTKQHKLRIKEVIYGGCFNYYNDKMDFTHSVNTGGIITIDNRKK